MTAFRAAFKAYRMHQVLIMPRFARLTIALGLATAVFPVDAEYYFNPRFLSNDLAESVDLSAFTKGREAPPGTYRVDIYLNDEFMTSRDITFIADDNNAELIPCLSTDLLVSLGIKKIALLDNKEHSAEKHVPDNSACTPLQDRLADASTEFDVGQQHLSLSVPQIYVGRMARGYVSPDLWEEGINAGLLNYSFNGNSINNRSNHNAGKSNYAYLNLQSGINIGSWRLRDNSTWSYYSGSSNSSDSNKWQHINTSAERDIIPLRSRLTVGDSYTDGDIFDSVNDSVIKISGRVLDYGCTVSSDSLNFTVDLQKNSARQFPTTGSTSPAVPFQITLSECSKGTTGVRVAFNGIEDAENNTLLKLDEGSNTASGLGIEILDGNMRPVKLNDLHAGMQWIPLVPEQNNILPYSARLKSTQKSVNPGLVRASATFTLEFQ
ncbi:fimbria/pilus outer membrane usher protein [Escherichia coli]|nr:fimbria/pilus outer membrane usher protein [Escherichia coli]